MKTCRLCVRLPCYPPPRLVPRFPLHSVYRLSRSISAPLAKVIAKSHRSGRPLPLPYSQAASRKDFVPSRTLILLDRDGVLNRESSDYIKSVAELEMIPGSIEAVAALSLAGHQIAVITNQSGIARGLIKPDSLSAIHSSIAAAVAALGGRINHFEFCPHAPEDGCGCRKPQSGLIDAARAYLQGSFETTLLIGDRMTDLDAGIASGCQPILVRTGHGAATELRIAQKRDEGPYVDLRIFDDLAHATSAILNGEFSAINVTQ
jgi:D-glycero-D-manno-heptose 1,7-bisphosphate phosphatase